jgi:glycosyltransferase involved in cell wall biosynthesis
LTVLEAGNGHPPRPPARASAESALGPQPQVIFTGYVPEDEKVDHYRVADLYVMPSRGEGFGIVFLEALACGLPVIGSKVDGGREALRNGELGSLVDPANADELKSAIRRGLAWESRSAPEGLACFSYAEFERRCHHLLETLVPAGKTGGQPTPEMALSK